MKRIFFVTALLIVSACYSNAQIKNKGYVGLNLGFGSVGGDAENCDPGFNIDVLNLGYSVFDFGKVRLGAGIRWSAGFGNVDQNIYEEYTWGVAGLYVGPFASYEISEKLILDLKFFPGQTTISEEIDDYETTLSDFGLSSGLAMRYNFSNQFGLYIGYDQQYSKIKKDDRNIDLNYVTLAGGVVFCF